MRPHKYHVRVLAGRLDCGAGSHVYHRQLVRRLAGRGHRVSVVCFQKAPELADCAECYECPLAPFDQSPLVWRFAALRQYRRCTRLLRRLALPPADVVIAGEHLFLKGHARAFPGTPWIYLPHSLVVSREIESYRLPRIMGWVTSRLYRHLQTWALERADRTLRFTQRGCDALRQHYGGRVRPRFVVNPVGVDLPAPDRQPRGGEVRLLAVGQLVYGKRIDFLIRLLGAFRSLRWRLDVVGDGAMRSVLEAMTEEQGLGGRVHFHGHQADPGPFYRGADLLLFPSRCESLGLVLLEAMSHGVPCLAFRSDGVTSSNVTEELVEHGRTGLLATGEHGFQSQLESVLRRPDILGPLGPAARRCVAQTYSWERHLEGYEHLFDQLVRPCATPTQWPGGGSRSAALASRRSL
jgi:glycosyltransferase involved in cell wall biosynthesis